MKKASKIIAIFIFAMSVFLGVGAVEVFADTASQTNTVNEPVKFIAKQKGKKVVLKWNKSKNVKGYIIYKNGKKFKTLKKNKLTDKKVKKNTKDDMFGIACMIVHYSSSFLSEMTI